MISIDSATLKTQKIIDDIYYSNDVFATILKYGTKLLVAILILLVGAKLIKVFIKFISKNFIQKKVDASLQAFIIQFSRIVLYILLFLVIAQTAGIQVTSFIAVLVSASFAIGLALQGSLSNFAGGIIILMLKPFKVGDFIETLSTTGSKTDVAGKVTEIQLFYTVLHTLDNKKINIPNAYLSNASTINYTSNHIRRIDVKVNISSKANMRKVKEKLLQIANSTPLILRDQPVNVVLGDFDQSSQVFYARVWGNTDDYWDIYYDLTENIKHELDIEIVDH